MIEETFLLHITDEFFVAPRVILIKGRKQLVTILSLLSEREINSIEVLENFSMGNEFLEELKDQNKPKDLEFGKKED